MNEMNRAEEGDKDLFVHFNYLPFIHPIPSIKRLGSIVKGSGMNKESAGMNPIIQAHV